MFENRVKTLLAEGRTALGVALPDASDLLARFSIDCGIDFLWIDLEHRPYGPNEVRNVPIMCRQKDCVPLIRVPNLDPGHIKQSLDIGASAIMVPQVDNAEQARRAVEYAKYPPEGSRGVSPLWTAMMGVSWNDYLPVANQETCVIVQIESPDGIRNLDEIAAVEGVDIVFAGPADLSASLGVIGQLGHPKVEKLLEEFPARIAAHGKAAGITFGSVDRCALAIEQGYRLVNFGSVAQLGTIGITAELARLRKLADQQTG
ncbi:MAG: hypothetical protein KDA79_01610 [Planctomycetaceae bacterium]|nr:hypothetical protein [Planctomycetaceae bacterium]